MPHETKPWYSRLLSPLRQAFAAPCPAVGQAEYLYDESAFLVFEGADLDEDVNAKTGRSPAGFVGCAEFRYVQDPVLSNMPFAVDHTGKKLSGKFLLEYDSIARRIRNLKENGIRPTQSEKALFDLDTKLSALRRSAGFTGRVLSFPDQAL